MFLLGKWGLFWLQDSGAWRMGWMAVCLMACLILFIAVVYSLRQVLMFSPALKVDTKGITDKVSFSEAGFIPWEQIEEVYIGDASESKALIIRLSPDFSLPDPRGSWAESVAKDTFKEHGHALSLAQRNIRQPIEEALARIYELQP